MAGHGLQHTSLGTSAALCPLSPNQPSFQHFLLLPAYLVTHGAAPEGIINVCSDKKASNSVIKMKVIRLNFHGLFLCR